MKMLDINVQGWSRKSYAMYTCMCCFFVLIFLAIGESFDKYMAEFSVLLFASLQNIAVHQVGVVRCYF